MHPAGSWTTARTKRTAQAPGRPSSFLGITRHSGEAGDCSPTPGRKWTAFEAVKKRVCDEVSRRRGVTGAEADGGEGVGGLRSSVEVGERKVTGPGGAKAARVDVIFGRAP